MNLPTPDLHPSTPDFSTRSWREKKAILEAWVARLNANKEGRLSADTERWIGKQLDALDAERMGSPDPQRLEHDVDDWLETAGDVGGPEQEQDPTRPHPRGWHGNRE